MNWYTNDVENLFDVILALENKEQAKRFFRDLLTESELLEFSNRWKAVRMLSANIPYTQITKATGLSSTTISRISKWLNTGSGGYQEMLSKSHHPFSFLEKG